MKKILAWKFTRKYKGSKVFTINLYGRVMKCYYLTIPKVLRCRDVGHAKTCYLGNWIWKQFRDNFSTIFLRHFLSPTFHTFFTSLSQELLVQTKTCSSLWFCLLILYFNVWECWTLFKLALKKNLPKRHFEAGI